MSATCSFCGKNPVWAKKLCRNCYERNRRYGSPEYRKRKFKHEKSDQKIKIWIENEKSYTKAARIIGCSRQAVFDAVKRHYKQTNADRIRQMSDEELADFLCYWDNCASTEGLGYNTEKVGEYWLCSAPGGGDINGECQACAMAWLKSPVNLGADKADKEGEE